MFHHQGKIVKAVGFQLLSGVSVLLFLFASIGFRSVTIAEARSNNSAAPVSVDAGALLKAPVFVPLPSVTVGTGSGSVMLGDDFTITATFRNNGDTGYGPFIDLYIPHLGPDGVFVDPLTYDGISAPGGGNYTATMGSENLIVVTQIFPDADGAGPGTTGCVQHPWGVDDAGIFLDVCGTAGDQLVSIQIPYGSYTSSQPGLSISIPAHLSDQANLGTALDIRARSGFIYGATPMVDWCCTVPKDTTIVSSSSTPDSWPPRSSVTPSVVIFSKSSNVGALPTGPNNPATYTMTVNIADGQPFTGISITDNLPNSIVYMGNLTSSLPYTSISQPPVGGPYNGAQIILTYADQFPTPTPITSDIVITFDYYVPDLDADGNVIAPGSTVNTATLDTITWQSEGGTVPVDVSVGVGPGVATHSDEPITLGKASTLAVTPDSNGPTPGDKIRYTITFEISDYFGFTNLDLTDVLDDGQHYYQDATYFPTLRIVRDGGTETYNFGAANVNVVCNYTGASGGECDSGPTATPDGATTITFDINQELIDQTNPDKNQILGDYVNDGGGIANATTIGTVTFYAVMLDMYVDANSGESVKMGDSLGDNATLTASRVDPATCISGTCSVTVQTDTVGAGASVSVGRGTLEKTIVARNGAVCNPATFDACTSVQVSASDSITYRITYDLPTGDFDSLSLTDFLPLPIYYADDPNADGVTPWSKYTGAASVPDAGGWMLGPNDTRGIDPAVTISSHTADNFIKFDFGTFDDLINTPKKIDILFTVRVTDQKFGDGLKMRNSVLQQDANSPGTTSTTSNFIDLTLTEPLLVGEKTVVSTDHVGVEPNPPMNPPVIFELPGTAGSAPWNSGTTPINSDYLDANPLGSGIGGIDGGDMVKFAIVIENTGSGINGAYDITLRDILPAGYIFPGLGLGGFNLQVYRGDGKALDDGTGSGFEFLGTVAEPGPDGLTGTPDDFFGAGIRLKDPSANPAFEPTDPEYGHGLCQLHEAASGKNVIIVTYDLMVSPDIAPGTVLQNMGQVTNYSASEGGTPYIPGPIESSSDSEISIPTLQKQLTTTEVSGPGNDHTQAVVGEFLTYTLTATFLEGVTPAAQIVDTLDAGLAFVDLQSVTASNPDTDLAGAADRGIYSSVMTFNGAGLCTNCTAGTNPLIENNGNKVTFDFGTLTNSDNDNAIAETITIVYRVMVLNVASNQSATTPLNNTAVLSWTGGSDSKSANPVAIVEPNVNVTKAVDITTGVDAGDLLTYTVTISNPSALPAFDATLSDAFPFNATTLASQLENITITNVTDTDLVTPMTAADFTITCDDSPGCAAPNRWSLSTVTPFDVPQNRTITLTITANVSPTAFPNATIDNYAQVRWTSMDGDFSDRSAFVPVLDTSDSERTGADGSGGLLNDYARQSPVVARTTMPNLAGAKYFIVSSEAGTSDAAVPPRVTIGEVVRYRIALRLNEGTMPDLSMLDRLPTGLRFIDDTQARVAFVSDGVGITSSTLDGTSTGCGAGLNVNGTLADIANLSSASIVCPLPDTAVSTSRTIVDINNDIYNSGTDVYFKFGNILNSDNDASQEFIVVEFNAVVENISSNQAQNNLTAGVSTLTRGNNFQAFINTASAPAPAALFTSNTINVQIAEPAITNLAKSVSPASGDAGDQVEYTVTFSNVSSINASPAYDVVLTDNVPAKMTVAPIIPATDITFAPALCGAFSSDTSSGNTITLTFTSLNSGCAVSVKYRATLQTSVIPGEILTNSAVVNYSSLPLTTGTIPNPTGSNTPGATGAPTGERNDTGGQGADGTILNNYRDLAATDVNITAVQPVKSLASSSDPLTLGSNLTVGEVARYRMLLILAEGTSPVTQIRDNLPAGLQYLDDGDTRLAFVSDDGIPTCVGSTATVSSTNGAIGTNPWICGNETTIAAITPSFVLPATAITGAPFNEGTDPTFNLSDIVNSDTDTNAEYILMEFNARVLNVAGNQDVPVTTINNNFTVLINAIDKGTSANVPVTVVEPIITLDKQLSSITGTADAGGVATYTVTMTNTGSAPAYDSNLIDALPAVLDFNPASVSFAFTGGASGSTDNSSDVLNRVNVTIGTIPVGGSATITYTANILATVTPNQLIQNTGNVTWTSLTGTDANERDGSGGINNYSTSDFTSFNSQALVPVKSIVSTTAAHTSETGNGSVGSERDLTIGEVIRYRLAVTIPEGTVSQLQLLDTLPAGFTFLNDGDIRISFLANTDMTEEADLAGADNDALPPTFLLPAGRVSVVGQDVTFTVADLATANNLVNNDNDADDEFVVIDFNVRVNDDANNNNTDLDSNDFDLVVGGTTVVTSNVVGTRIVEPLLDITKLVDDATWAYGQTVLYTVQLTHTAASLSAAQDLVITDQIPAGLTYVAGTIVAPIGWIADDTNAPDLTWTCSGTCSMLTTDGILEFTYQARVNDPPVPPALPGGGTATNTVSVAWNTLSGVDANERSYTDSASVTGTLDEYRYALGNRVWFDTNNNSLIDNDGVGGNPDEVGVDNVSVDLYKDDGTGNLVYQKSATTINGGYYLFDYLVAGDYVVVLPSTNFDTSAVLDGYYSSATSINSSGALLEGAAALSNTDIDSDDNGMFQTAGGFIGGVASSTVTIGGVEPINESDLNGGSQGVQPDNRANMTVDFGFYRTAIGDIVWLDENIDGEYDAGETLVDGASVRLYVSDGTTDVEVRNTTTDINGEYSFTDLPNGDYIIKVVGPAGTVSTTDAFNPADTTDPDVNANNNDNGIGKISNSVQSGTVTMTAGSVGALTQNTVVQNNGTTTNPTLDFGFVYPYALGNRVWFDTDNNSQIDFANELGVDGVTVDLYSSADLTTIVATDTTSPDGYYLFDNLFPGEYVVVLPASNFNGGALTGYWSSATLRAADGTIGETAAPDADDDADSDDNGTMQTVGGFADAVISSPVTVGPFGLVEPASESDLEAGVGQGTQPDGRSNLTVDFGFYRVEVGNLVYSDGNQNGNYESLSDVVLSGATVQLYITDGTTETEVNIGPDGILRTADDLSGDMVTDVNGLYLFSGLPQGDYIVKVTAPTGTSSTVDGYNVDDDNTDPNVNADDNDNGIGTGPGIVTSGLVTLTPGYIGAPGYNNNIVTYGTGTTSDPTLDFGFIPVFSLGNRVWFDTNNSGQINGLEVGIDNVDLELYNADASGVVTTSTGSTATTSAGGYYLFNNLPAGNYVVVIPASNFSGALNGYWSSGTSRDVDGTITELPAALSNTDSDSDDNGVLQTSGALNGAVISSFVTLGPNTNTEPFNELDLGPVGQGQPDRQANMTVDFGFYTIELGNQVWSDVDNSGLLDGLETGIFDVTVELWPADGSGVTPLDTATTDINGFYNFTGLPRGEYLVRIPNTEFEGAGTLRDYVSSTGGALTPYEPAPDTDSNFTDSDDNGTETVGALGLGGYVQTAVISLTPAGEQSVNDALGLTTEPRVDFGVFNSPRIDLSITKTDNVLYYLVGGTLNYEIVVTNSGPADVVGAVVTDVLPSQISAWTWDCAVGIPASYNCTSAISNSLDFTDSLDLPSGASVTYNVTAEVDVAAIGDLTNEVTVNLPVGSLITESNLVNNSAQDIDTQASLVVTKDDGLTVVGPGTSLTYVITVQNTGDVDLTNITLTDTLSADLTYKNASLAPTTVAGNTLTWSGLSITAGSSMTINVEATVSNSPSSTAVTNNVDAADTNTGATATASDVDSVVFNSNFTKTLLGTNENFTQNSDVAIGEIVTYEITANLEAGLAFDNVVITDRMDKGLAFVDCVSVTLAGANITNTVCPPTVTDIVDTGEAGNPANPGRQVQFNIGNITANEVASTLVLRYRAVVLDVIENQETDVLNNGASWTWLGGLVSASADDVIIVEPDLTIDKSALPTTATAGTAIEFTLTIAHTTQSSADAFDVVVTDILPAGLEYISCTPISYSGLAPTTQPDPCLITGGELSFVWESFPLNETATIKFFARYTGSQPTLTNNASVAWSSLPLDPGGTPPVPVQLSTFNSSSTERWYDPLDPVNIYQVVGSVSINFQPTETRTRVKLPKTLPATGFAPNVITTLPQQPADKSYSVQDVWIEIPTVKLNTEIVGVPLVNDDWDVTWLWQQAGWLNGTAFPGWQGNSVLTGHVTLPNGKSGPFDGLDKLQWGDKVIVHAYGSVYTYEVRENSTVSPNNTSVLQHEEEAWLTLLTCKTYNERTNTYSNRIAVRAVLLKVEREKLSGGFGDDR